MLQAADRGEVSALCMLDLSAAFDLVDHELLLRRLEFRFGFTGDVLEWIKSYLTNRTFNNNIIMWQRYQGEPSQRLQIMPS